MALHYGFRLLRNRFILLGHSYKTLGGILTTAEDNILQGLQQLRRDIAIHHLRSRVYNGHIHTGTYGVIEEYGVHSLAQVVISTQRERQITHAATDTRLRQILMNPLRSTNEIQRIWC